MPLEDRSINWDRVVVAIAAVVGVIVLIPVGLVVLGFGIGSYQDWDYSRHRAAVDDELMKMGLSASPFDNSPHPRQPDIALPSPNGAWTLLAQWIDVRGYNWGVRNNRTGKVYLRTEKIRPDNWFPPRIDVLWSPDSAYVAVTSEDGVEVAHMRGDDAVGTQLSLGEDDWQKNTLLNAADLAQFEGWISGRTKALAWEGPDRLNIETCLDVRMKSDESERVVAEHIILRFHDEDFDVIWKNCDFYESLPADDF